MILVRLMGGMGNQMFQYAFGKALAVKNKTVVKLDLSLLEDRSVSSLHAVYRNFELNIFETAFLIATHKEVDRFNIVYNRTFFNKVLNKLKNMIVSSKNVIQNGHCFDLDHLSLKDDHCIIGRWQSELYFENIKDTIRTEFHFKIKLNDFNRFYKQITHSNSVAIHVRRGDYVSNKLYAEGIGALDMNYYIAAIDVLKKKESELLFFVFSDDIAWCKNNFVQKDVVFVEQEKEFDRPEFDMQLIGKCKHQIISNSTFSWWGAWLSENANSIIVAPKTWARKVDFIPENIIPDRWIKIENGFEKLNEQ